jgi:hypothetical protein
MPLDKLKLELLDMRSLLERTRRDAHYREILLIKTLDGCQRTICNLICMRPPKSTTTHHVDCEAARQVIRTMDMP